jgi:tetratricopeptide (TPR) repeat protein
MATYNKRGYKQPKPEEDKTELVENINISEQESETAEVFNTLDEKASKIGGWFSKNSKAILYGIGGLAVLAAGYAAYSSFVAEPKEDEAANDMFQAQQYYDQAVNGVGTDSLYNLALKGGEGKLGFLGIIEEYKGTDAENLAHYYAGTSYLNLGKYKEAIDHLAKFNSDDLMMKAMSLGAIGDAFVELNQMNDAYDYYKKAAETNKNDFTTPRYSFKAGVIALELGKKEEALKFFTDIEENYKGSVEAGNIDTYLGMAQ